MPPRRSDQCPNEQRRLSPARESLGSRRRFKELVGFGSCTDHGRRRLTSKASPSNAKQKYESLKMSPRWKPDDFDNRLRDFSAFVEMSRKRTWRWSGAEDIMSALVIPSRRPKVQLPRG